MNLVVFSHKLCWRCEESPSGYATDGGFPFQIQAISELFDATTLVVPCSKLGNREGEIPLTGHHLSVASVSEPFGSGIWRKVGLLIWLILNTPVLIREMLRADAVHAPIPGDIGTFGILLSFIFRKPLFVRYCGNWFVQKTTAERLWRWFMESFASARNVMLATGGAPEPPSPRNPNLRWIFSTSLTEKELGNCRKVRKKVLSKDVRLIIACRQQKGKGTEVLLESLPTLLEDYPNVTLDVVGSGSHLDYLKQLAVSLNIDNRVKFHGKVDHNKVIRLLQEADLFCYPTASEGFPKVVLEALACGLPVVTTPVSVLPELIANGSGLILQDVTPDGLAKAIRHCLVDAELFCAMSQRAQETARQYSLERWRDVIGDLLTTAWGPLKTNV